VGYLRLTLTLLVSMSPHRTRIATSRSVPPTPTFVTFPSLANIINVDEQRCAARQYLLVTLVQIHIS
jgi:hypothetical protein